jgi:uncharacterized protein
MISRRTFLYGGTVGLLSSVLYTRFLEPSWLEVKQHQVPFFSTPGPTIKILHLSDLHYSKVVPLDFILKSLTLGLKHKPDLICLTGDYITGKILDFKNYQELLSQFSEKLPTYACLGNHDYPSWGKLPRPANTKGLKPMAALFKLSGIQLLHNQSKKIQVKGRTFQIVGLGDWWRNLCRPETAFAQVDSKIPSLVLSHNPDSKEALADYPWNLMLCGHTHGGQIKLPFFGALHAPVKDWGYLEGLKPWGKRWIHTTRGVGNLHGIRFNCRPEVSLIHLT